MRCCQYFLKLQAIYYCLNRQIIPAWFPKRFSVQKYKLYYLISLIQKQRCISAISHHVSTFLSIKQHANLCPRSLHINFRLSPYPAKSHRLVGCFNSKSYNTAHICHFVFRQYRIILSVDTASEGLLPPKHDAGTATRHYRAFWQRRCRAAAAGAVLEPLGGNCAVLPFVLSFYSA